jgi:hypothetical protein
LLNRSWWRCSWRGMAWGRAWWWGSRTGSALLVKQRHTVTPQLLHHFCCTLVVRKLERALKLYSEPGALLGYIADVGRSISSTVNSWEANDKMGWQECYAEIGLAGQKQRCINTRWCGR